MNIFKGQEKNRRDYELEKWILVSFEIESSELCEKETDKNIVDMIEIILNTHFCYTGYFNPLFSKEKDVSGYCYDMGYVYKDGKIFNGPYMSYGGETIGTVTHISKMFYPDTHKENGINHIRLIPLRKLGCDYEDDYYCLKGLDMELGCLAGAQNLICEQYDIELEQDPRYPKYTLTKNENGEEQIKVECGIINMNALRWNMDLYSKECKTLFDRIFPDYKEAMKQIDKTKAHEDKPDVNL